MERLAVDPALNCIHHSTMKLNHVPKHFDRTLGALAHPTRRAILERLMTRERTVTELAAPFRMSLNAVSKHIRVLEQAKLVRRRREWREHFVSFNPAPIEEVRAWMEEARKLWMFRLELLDDMLKEEDAAAGRSKNEDGGKAK